MPTVLRSGTCRIYFHSHEPHEPPHVHVDRDAQSAKFWLGPVRLARNIGFGTVDLRRIGSILHVHEQRWWRLGMTSSTPKPGERIRNVCCTSEALVVELHDGRSLSVPLTWFPRLLSATPAQRAHWTTSGGGYGIHWPDIDEDLSVEGLLRGTPA